MARWGLIGVGTRFADVPCDRSVALRAMVARRQALLHERIA